MEEHEEEKSPKEEPAAGETIQSGCAEDDPEGRLHEEVHDFIQENFADECYHISDEREGRLYDLAETLGGLEKPLAEVLADGEKDTQFRMGIRKILSDLTALEVGLDRAFDRLASQDYIVAQRYGESRCNGQLDLEDDARKLNSVPKGYVFYCYPDAEEMDKKGFVYIAYGVFGRPKDEQEAIRKVGEEAAAAFRWAGLTVEWDGDPEKALFLKPCLS